MISPGGLVATLFKSTGAAVAAAVDTYFAYVSLLLNGETTAAPFTADASATNLSIAPIGSTRNDPFSPFDTGNYSVAFNGSTDYLTTPSNTALALGTGDFTVETWVYFNSVAGTYVPFCQSDVIGGTSTNDKWFFALHANTLNFGTHNGGGYNASTPWTPVVGQWYHVAVTRTSGTTQLYINGMAGAMTGGASGNGYTLNQNGISIGTMTTPFYLNGNISNLRIVKGTALYASAFTPSTTALTAVSGTSLLTCQSARVADTSSNAFTVTATGTPSISPKVPFAYISASASAYFNGTTDYMTVANNTATTIGTSTATVEFWMYPTSQAGYQRLVSTTSGGFTAGTLCIRFNSGSFLAGGVTWNGYPTLNMWNHVAWVGVGGSSQTLYINGVNVGTAATAYNITEAIQFIGGYYSVGPTEFASGYISNVRVVKGTAVYSSNFTPSTSPLTAIANTTLLTLQNQGPANNNSVLDSSANRLTVTRVGSPTQGTSSPFSQTGWSAYFPGNQSSIYTASTTSLGLGTGNFTMECWILPTAIAANGPGTIFDFRSAATATATTVRVNASMQIMVYDNSIPAEQTFTGQLVTMNVWNHIAITRSGNTLTAYINGASAGSFVFTANIGTNQPINIGANQTTGYSFNGYISNVRVGTTVVYTGPFTPPTAPLAAIAGTQILTLQDNHFKDNSTNNLALTAYTTPSVQALSPFEPTASWSAGVHGGSIYFNNSTIDSLVIPSSSALAVGTADFTVEFWTNVSSVANNPRFFLLGQSGADGITVQVSTANTLIVCLQNATDAATVSWSIPTSFLNSWHHIAASRQSGVVRLFVDGALVASATNAVSISQYGLYVGGVWSALPGYNVNGYMSNVRFINGTAAYTSAFTPPTAPLTAIANTQLLLSNTNFGIVDATGKNDVNTIATARTSTVQTKFGSKSLYFNGSTDYLTIPTTPNLVFGSSDFTVECWVNTPGTVATAGIFAKKSPGGYGIEMITTLLQPSMVVSVNGTTWGINVGSSISLVANTWTHLALSRKGNNFYLFVNGALGATATLAGTVYDNNFPFVVGGAEADATYPFMGYIDDFRFTKGYARYWSGFAVPTAPCGDNSTTDPYFSQVSLLLHGDGASYTAPVFNNNTIIDTSINALAITRAGTPTQGTVSPFNDWNKNAYSWNLNGSSDYITAGAVVSGANPLNVGNNSSWTIETWFNWNALPTTSNVLCTVYYNATYRWTIEPINSTTISIIFIPGTACTYTLATPMVAGTWYHLAAVRNGTTVALYINGVAATPGTGNTNNLMVFGAGVGSFYIGQVGNGGYYFNGALSNFRITNTAVYTGAFTPPTSPLTAIPGTLLLTAQNPVIFDASSNAIGLGLGGAPALQTSSPFAITVPAYSAATNGGSVAFDGTDGTHLVAPNVLLGTNDFTVEFWVYKNLNKAYQTFLGNFATAGTTQWQVFSDSTGQYINVFWDTGHFVNTVPVNPGTWNHIAWTRTGNVGRLFVNGTVVATESMTNNFNGGTALWVGHTPENNTTRGLNGYMSGVKIVNGTSLYTANFTPAAAPAAVTSNTALLLNGVAGGIVDAAGKANLVTIGNTATQTAIVKYGTGAMKFNGTPDSLVAASSAAFDLSVGDWTIEGWFYPTATTNFSTLAMCNSSNTVGHGLMMNAAAQWTYYVNGTVRITGSAVTTNAWTHLAAVRSAGTTTLYVNGTSVGTTTTAPSAGSVPFTVGAKNNAMEYFTGYADDIRVTKGIARYTSNFTAPTAILPNSSATDTYFSRTSLLLQGDIQNVTKTVATDNVFIDSSTNTLAITATGTPSQGTFSPFDNSGWSTYLNGSTDYVTVPNGAATTAVTLGTGDFTMEWWQYAMVSTAYSPIIRNSSASGWGNIQWYVSIDATGTLLLVCSNGGGAVNYFATGASTMLANQWQHIAIVRSSGTWYCYINGVSKTLAIGAGYGLSMEVNTTAQPLNIGGFPGWTPLVGYMSNFRLVKGVAVYSANFTPSTTPLTAVSGTSVLTLQDNRFKDNSANNFALTINGTPSIQAKSPFAVSTYSAATNGGSIYFPGSGNYLSAPSSSVFQIGNTYTIECWIYRTSNTTTGSYVNTLVIATSNAYSTVVQEFMLSFDGGALNFRDSSSGAGILQWANATTNIPLNTWAHIAVVRNGSGNNTLSMYVNGVMVVQANCSNAQTTTTPLYIGGDGTANCAFPGYVSNFRVVTGSALYTSNFAIPTAPLTAVGNTQLLLSGTNAAANDASGTSDVMFVGAAQVSGFSKFGNGSIFCDGAGAATGRAIISNPNAVNLGASDFTMECWVYQTQRNTYNFIYNRASGGTNATTDVEFWTNASGNVVFAWYTGATAVSLTTTSIVPLAAWTHVAVTRQSGVTRVYVNGVQDSVTTTNTGANNDTGSQGWIGNQAAAATRAFPGYVDEFRLTKGVVRYTGGSFTLPTAAFPTK